MLLERFVILLSVFVIVSTIVSFVFHERVHLPTGSNLDGTVPSQQSYYLANEKKFLILNETLSSLKAELQFIRSIKDPISAVDRQPSYPSNNTNGEVAVALSSIDLVQQKDEAPLPQRMALLFTMDSIRSYESQSKQGGAAGEILVRRSLEKVFGELNIRVDVKGSDEGSVITFQSFGETVRRNFGIIIFLTPVFKNYFGSSEFESADMKAYDFVFVDPWTWAAKGWLPKKNLIGCSNKIYILDFFGSERLRGNGLDIPPSRFLTAFNTTLQNSFLGYYVEENEGVGKGVSTKRMQGVIWAKENKHLDGKSRMIEAVADRIPLLSTSQVDSFHHKNIKWVGHRRAKEWHSLLLESKFLLGLGSPLLGPSAIDAVSAGCMYINPIYEKPFPHNDQLYNSQHPYAVEKVGEPYVCSYMENNAKSLQECVNKAMNTDLVPFIPYDFTKEAYIQRVRTIFNL